MRKLILLFLGLVIAATMHAIPADSTPRTLKLKDGRILTISLQGDEYLSWAKTIDGYIYLDEVQLPGKKRMQIRDMLNGLKK